MLNALYQWATNHVDPFAKNHMEWESKTHLQQLRSLVFIFPKHTLVLLLVVLVETILTVFLLSFVGFLIDQMEASGPELFWQQNMWLIVTAAVAFLVAKPVFSIAYEVLISLTLHVNILTSSRVTFFDRLLNQDMTFFQKEFAGNLASKTFGGGREVAELFWAGIGIVIPNFFFAGSLLIALSWLHWYLGVVMLVWIGLFAVLAYIRVPIIRDASKEGADIAHAVNGSVVDVYSNIQTVKLFQGNDRALGHFTNQLRGFKEAIVRFRSTVVTSRMLVALVGACGLAAFTGLSLALWHQQAITTGEVAIVLGFAIRLEGKLLEIFAQLTGLFRSYGSFKSTARTMEHSLGLVDDSEATNFHYEKGLIEFNNVDFAYGQQTAIVKDLNFIIQPGEKVGIVGHSGTGKSTVVNLLLRMYDVEGGAITIDHQDLRSVTQESLRVEIGLVTQDTSLFHRSIFDNISLGKDDVEMEDVREAARRAHALEFIEALEDNKGRKGFEAFVGERGIKLSGGQRQRIALARVFLKNPPILILDEATSALDTKLDADIQEILNDVMKDKTTLAIAHRLTTVARMDRLIVMDKGQIVEAGTHAELLAKDGIYAELWHNQFYGVKSSATDLTPTETQ
ncbi:putative multidrug export ATP-binding/permease protein [Pseudovibrio sp. Ad13]|uniref:ABC transporter ATP-binding protein n=1 Tax=Pseudovibrio sp. Ad13 TaxID=989396 RepID=UPI0007B23760|nr:ABC transporter ATP-binding protein [Pseudovibrio sp. Ad13]KZK86152.1 putative multidrug export ATP-binding/permease protein [Pseudovibrio sp. Ad13]